MCNWPYIFFLSTEGGKVSFAAKAARHQICIVSAPAMFPQHCYKTPLRVSAVMRKKVDLARLTLRLKQTHLSLFFTNRLDQHQESWYEKKKTKNIWLWGLRHCMNDWSAFWILTGQRVMLCSHWLMLMLSSRVVHFLRTRSQPQYGSLAPTQALRERKSRCSRYIKV